MEVDKESDRSSDGQDSPSPIPNGGIVAWLQVLGSFFLFLNTWGIINSYGVFQTYYEETLLPELSSSSIAWIGSVQSFIMMFSSIVSGPLLDAGYLNTLLRMGALLIFLGHIFLSLSTTYWQIFLAQTVCIGIGSGAVFIPGLALLPDYFDTRISFAMGIAASGSSLGGVIYPISLHRLIQSVGFPWAVRVLGFIALAGLIVACIVMKVRVQVTTRRKRVDLTAFRELPFVTFTTGVFISFLGLYVPFYFIQPFAIVKEITNTDVAFYIVPIINGASIFGRILPNFIADKFGALNILAPCALISGILILTLLAVTKSLASLLVICAIYGFVSGTFVSLAPSVLVYLTHDKSLIATRLGMYFTIISISLLFGTPIGGAVEGNAGYASCWIYGGVMTIFGSCLIGLTKVILRFRKPEL